VAGQTNVWAEGASAIEGIPFRDREQLGPAACLAVWTIPPGPLVLHEALSRVSPEQVAFFDVDPGLDELGPFLQRLLGLTKHVLRAKGGEMSLEALAGQMAHTVSTVRLGLRWLADRGQIEIAPQGEDRVLLCRGARHAMRGRDVVQEQLQEALEEAAAYRSYYRRVDLQVLLDVS
jgi:single-stranded-DNA-specific exonuclease